MGGRRTWTRERILAALRELDAEGVEMSYRGIDHRDHGLYLACIRHFGGLDHAIETAGLTRMRRNRQWSRDAVIGEIRRLHRRGADLSARGMAESEHGSVYVTARTMFGSWDRALEAAGIRPDEVRRLRRWDAEAVADRLRERIGSGLSVRASAIRREDGALYHAMLRYYGDTPTAVRRATERSWDNHSHHRTVHR